MPSMEELQDQIKDLEAKLKEEQEKKSVVYRKDCSIKISTFNSSEDNVEEWTASLLEYVKRYTTETDKIRVALDHLDKKAKTEVQFRINIKRTSVEEIANILIKVYKKSDRVVQLQQDFYNRNQQKDESIEDYLHVLMEKALIIKEKDAKLIGDMQATVKEKLAEGVYDASLRRVLRRLNDERSTLELQDLREHAERWSANMKKVNSSSLNEVGLREEDKLDVAAGSQFVGLGELTSLIKKQ